ncbi:MAG: response regulator [Paracoccaceae bacterium]
MPDDLEAFMITQTPTAERPLLGVTVLVVEDSLFACEAMRLLCLRSGARIRRADSLKSAHRHLSVYRPVVVIVDLGLPDGSGAGLIAELANATPRITVILGISGDPDAREAAITAGADGFLEKPLVSLAAFQSAILAQLPADQCPRGPRSIADEEVTPDPLALQDDLANVSDILSVSGDDAKTLTYVAQFLGGIAKLTQDAPLALAAAELDKHCQQGEPYNHDVARIAGLVQERLQDIGVV